MELKEPTLSLEIGEDFSTSDADAALRTMRQRMITESGMAENSTKKELLQNLLISEAEKQRFVQQELQNSIYDAHENRKLTDAQVALFRQSFYAYSEEIDLFYCSEKEKDFIQDSTLTDSTIESRVQSIIEKLRKSSFGKDDWISGLR